MKKRRKKYPKLKPEDVCFHGIAAVVGASIKDAKDVYLINHPRIEQTRVECAKYKALHRQRKLDKYERGIYQRLQEEIRDYENAKRFLFSESGIPTWLKAINLTDHLNVNYIRRKIQEELEEAENVTSHKSTSISGDQTKANI